MNENRTEWATRQFVFDCLLLLSIATLFLILSSIGYWIFKQFGFTWGSAFLIVASLLILAKVDSLADWSVDLYMKALQRWQLKPLKIWRKSKIDTLLDELVQLPEGIHSLTRRIELCHQTLSLLPRSHLEDEKLWATLQMELGNSLYNLPTGDRAENIEQAIEAYQNAAQIRNLLAMPMEWAEAMNNLAIAYKDRIHGNRSENIERAIADYQESLQVRTRAAMPIEWAQTMHNLAIAYADRVGGDQAENTEHAIAAYEAALLVRTRADMPVQWSQTMNNLAVTYTHRIRGDQAENIETAINIFKDSLEVRTVSSMPIEWADTMTNLGTAFANRIHGERSENVEQALAAYRNALQVITLDLLPADFRDIQSNCGLLLFTERQWSNSYMAYAAAISASQHLTEAAYTEVGRQEEVRQSANLYASSAYCLWQLGQISATLNQLELGKTRLLNQALALGYANLDQLTRVQQETIQTLRQVIRDMEGEMRLPADTPARHYDRKLAELLRQARAKLSQQFDAIRAEYLDFMPVGLDVPEILELIPENGAMVAPCITSQGSFVFVILHGVVEVTVGHIVHLPNLTTNTVQAWLRGADTKVVCGWLGAYDQFRKNNSPDVGQKWFAAINRVCLALWQTLMGPVHQQLQTLKLSPGAPVLLMPQGGLGLLPLHAAWRQVNGEPNYFSDDYTVTYAPSGYALSVSQRRAAQPERQARSLFAAINPTGDLPYAPLEGETIANLFPSEAQTVLQEEGATTTAFPNAANGRAYLHYSGHGYYHWGDPLQSGLQLADKAYTLADILRELDLSGCRLVTLSACETGITDIREAPDEYVGLPAGFLQAGAPAVVSTLWAVNDLSTMLLMERFYQIHLQDSLDFASALRQAQLWLRDVTAGELANRFGHEAQQLMTRLTKDEALAYWYRFENMDEGERPFAHPYYWAAFTFTGA